LQPRTWALYTDEPAKARAVAVKYANHPVDRWRNTFVSLSHQLDEDRGQGCPGGRRDDRAQRQALLAARAPGVEFTPSTRGRST